MRKSVYILILACLGASCVTESESLRITNLRCENLKDPKVIEPEHPRFSWHLESAIRGERQSAVQVLVASSPDLLPDNPDIWNSGKMEYNDNYLDFAGNELESARDYY